MEKDKNSKMNYDDYRYVHAVGISEKDHYSIIASLKNIHTNETTLKIIDPVERPFYLTQDCFKQHNRKKDYELLSRVDKYSANQHELIPILKEALDIPSRKYVSRADLFNDVSVYGADIDPRVLLKQKLNSKEKVALKFNIGTLDIEQDVTDTKIVNLISFTNGDGETFTAALKSLLKGGTEEDILIKLKEEKIKYRKKLKDKVKTIFDTLNPKITFFFSDDELELIKWIFKRIHEKAPDYISIWNMGYDIPTLADRIVFRGGDIADIFCSDEIPKKYRFYKYDKGRVNKKEHWSYSWDYCRISGKTQFIDSMRLHSLLRKAKGILPSYTLQYVSKKILGVGKIDFDNDRTHYEMLSEYFIEYTVYNIFDTLIILLMNMVTHDVESAIGLSSTSLLENFNKQTIQLKDDFYSYCTENKAVIATTSGSQLKIEDEFIKNTGGNVLSPYLMDDIGIPIIEELDAPTKLIKFTIDVDVVSDYPSITDAFNIAKETKIYTALYFENNHDRKIEELFIFLPTYDISAVRICNEFFNLPSYDEILEMV